MKTNRNGYAYLENLHRGDYNTCFVTENKEHVVDWETLSRGETSRAGYTDLYDVWCSECGLSGTVWREDIGDSDEVNWGG